MKKTGVLILLLLVMILTVSAVGAADSDVTSDLALSHDDDSIAVATDDVVAADANTEILAAPGDKNFTQLQAEIDQSSYGMITLNSNYVRQAGESDIVINKNFNIFGNDVYTIDANNLGGIFKVNSGCSVLLSNVVLINGNSVNGGAIYNEGTVNIISSTLTDNNASQGGAIYNLGIATLSGSTLDGNTATDFGGAVYSTGTMVVDGSDFNDNTAKYRGGAIYNEGNLDVGGGSTFDSNDITFRTRNDDNGGAAVYNKGGTLTMDDVKVTNNLKNIVIRDGNAGDLLAGVVVTSGETTISNSYFANNAGSWGGAISSLGYQNTQPYTLTVKNTKFEDNIATFGGAIFVESSDLVVENCTFENNKGVGEGSSGTSSTQGGAIVVFPEGASASITDSTFIGNSADAGGAVSLPGIDVDSVIDNCTFTGNTATSEGGAVYLWSESASLTITDSEFTDNSATYGGAVCLSGFGGDSVIDNSTFKENTASSDGGAVYYWSESASLTVTDSEFTENSAPYGGAIENEGSGDLIVDGSNFTENTATTRGGAIISSGSTSVSNSVFTDNEAAENTNAIYLYYPDTTLSLSNNVITGSDDVQIVTKDGVDIITQVKVIILDGQPQTTLNPNYELTATVTDDNGNAIDDYNFAFKVEDDEIPGTYDSSDEKYKADYTFLNPGTYLVTAVGYDDADITTSEVTFESPLKALQNLIDDANEGDTIELTYGFAYMADYDAANVATGVVIDKDIILKGDGITIDGGNASRIFTVNAGKTLTLNNVTVCNGAAQDGAGVYVDSGAALNANDVIFKDNVAENNGGAIYTDGGAITLTDCVLDNNDVTEISTNDNSGGAAICAKNAQVTLVNTNVTNNGKRDLDRTNDDLVNAVINLQSSSAIITGGLFENNTGIYGGAIIADGDGSQSLIVTGATFNNNKAYNGGAIDISNMQTAISDCNFNDNWVVGPGSTGYYGIGGAVAADGTGSFTITNSNFTGNKATGANASAGAVSVGLDEGCAALIDNCEFKENTAVYKGGAVFIAGYGDDATLSNSKFSDNKAEIGNAVYNGGDLVLSGNTVEGDDSEIHTSGSGKINTHVWVIVNDNQDVTVEYYDTIPIVVKITDDNGNLIRINETTLQIDLGDSWTRQTLTLDEETGFYTMENYLVDQKSGLLTPSRLTLQKYFKTYNANTNLNSSYVTMTKANAAVEVTYENVSYPENVTITVNLTGKEGAPKISWAATSSTPFKVTVNDVEYKVKITNGIGTVTISDLPVGNYVINASWAGNTKYNAIEPQLYDLAVRYKEGTFTDLQYQIDNAQNGALELPYDFTYNETYDGDTFLNGVVISNDLSIDGKGYTIDANKKIRIFTIADGVTVTVSNITFKNGYADKGGAILTSADSLTISACDFIGNDPVDGGAIYVAAGETLVKEASTFTKNNATNGGAIYVASGATLKLDNVTFSQNNATEKGGAIYSEGTVTINNSVFDSNDIITRTSGDYGGAAIYNNGGSLIINNTNVTNNLKNIVIRDGNAGDLVSAAVVSNGETLINNSYFANNTGSYGGAILFEDTDSTLTVENTVFEGNNATFGGAIQAQASIEIDNCTFNDNHAVGVGSGGNSALGGAISVSSSQNIPYVVSVSIKDSNFTGNNATVGGAVDLTKVDGNIVIDGCKFENNNASNGAAAGAIDLYDSAKSTVSNSKFIANNAGNNYNGGAIFATSTDLDVDGCVFEDNVAGKYGGAIASFNAELNVVGSNFTGNNATSRGGAIYSENGKLSISGSKFESNKKTKTGSTDGGAAIYSTSADTVINNAKFINNINLGSNNGAIYYSNTDGGILNVTNSVFSGNDISGSSKNGKAINVGNGDLYLNNNTVNTTYAEIYVANPARMISYLNLTVMENATYDVVDKSIRVTVDVVDDKGNKVCLPAGTMGQVKFNVIDYASNQRLNRNATSQLYYYTYTLPSDDAAVYHIGATYTKDSGNVHSFNATIRYVKGTYTDLQNKINKAVEDGVDLELTYNFTYTESVDADKFPNGVVVNESITIDGKGYTISGNNSYRIFNVIDGATLTIKNVTLTNGTANSGGAILVAYQGSLIANHTTFNNNRATSGNGGAICTANECNVVIENSNFANNAASASGSANGGALHVGTSSDVTIISSNFTDNVAKSKGGAVYIMSTVSLTVEDSKFLRNNASDGGALGVYKTHVINIGKDSEFINNSAKGMTASGAKNGCGGAIHIGTNGGVTDSTTNIEDSTFIGNDATDRGGAIFINNNKRPVSIKNSVFANNTIDGTANAIWLALGELSLEGNTINTTYAEIYNKNGIITNVNATILENQTIDTAESSYDLVAVVCDDNGNLIYDESLQLTVDGEAQTTAPGYDKYTVLAYPLSEATVYKVNMTSTRTGQELDTYIAIIRNVRGTFTELQALVDDDMGLAMLDHNFTYNEEIDGEKFLNGVLIDSDVAIFNFGGNIVIDGKNKARIFNITNDATVMLGDDITLANGNATVGGAIYVDEGSTLVANKIKFINNTASESAGAIYADGDITIDNSLFDNNTVSADNLILANGINVTEKGIVSSISNSNFTGDQFVYNAGNLILINNKELSDKVPYSYSIYNAGSLSLEGNDFNNVIFNPSGKITSEVNATLNNNQTVTDKKLGDNVVVNATLTDYDGNAILDPNFRIAVDGVAIDMVTYDDATGLYTSDYTIAHAGDTIVSTLYDTDKINILTGIYEVPKANVTLTVTTGQNNRFKSDENVTIFVGLYDELTGDGLNETINVIVINTAIPLTIVNGSGSIKVSGLEPGQYSALGIFAGNDNYNGPVYSDAVFTVLYPDRILSIEVEDIKYGETAVINIEVKDADGNEDYGVVVVTVNGTEYTLRVDGQTSLEISGLAINEEGYLVEATLLEDEFNTEVVNDTESFTVSKADSTIEISGPDEIKVGDDAEITVVIPDSGSVTIWIDGDEYGTFEIEGTSGSILITSDYLPYGNYTINAQYLENDNYNASNIDSLVLKVTKTSVEPTITISGDSIVYGETAHVIVEGLPNDATGTATATIDGKDYSADVLDGLGQAIIEVPGLAVGSYELFAVTYSGDAKYENHTGMATIVVAPADSSVEIDEIADVTYPGDVTVTYTVANKTTVTVVVKDADGNEVTEGVTVDDESVTIAGLDAGEYTITITNAEGGNYSESSADATFKVLKATLEINPQAVGDLVVDGKINVTFTLPDDVDGTVSATIDGRAIAVSEDGEKYVITLDSLAHGNHTVIVQLTGDTNYNDATGSVTFPVSKVDPNITISEISGAVGETVDAVVTIEGGDATNFILVDGAAYVVENGQATVPVSLLTAGENTITVVYTGDDKYNKGNATFTYNVEQAGSSVEIDPIDTVVYPEDVVVTYTVENETTVSVVVIDSNGDAVTTGVDTSVPGTVIISGLDAGEYRINITNANDGNYKESSDEATFTVDKAVPIIEVSSVDVTYPGDVVVTVVADVDGAYVVSFNGEDEDLVLTAGVAKSVTFYDVDANEEGYVINVTYEETDNYYGTYNDTVSVKVFKATSEVTITQLNNVTYPDDVKVVYDIENRTGISVDIVNKATGATVFATITDNLITIANLDAGNYTITITNLGNENIIGSNATADFNVAKATPVIEVTTNDVTYPGSVVVTVNADVDGDYSVDVAGVKKDVVLVSGEAQTVSFGTLNANEGGYTIVVTYEETDNYNAAINDTVVVKVLRAASSVNISEIGIVMYPEDVKVIYDVENRTEVIAVVVNKATGESIHVSSEYISDNLITISGLGAGEYTITITNLADGNYAESSASAGFTVCGEGSSVFIYPIDDYYYGDTVIVNYIIENMTSIDVVITDSEGNEVTSGVDIRTTGQVSITGLAAGTYNITITNLATGNVFESNASASFNVLKYNITSMKATSRTTRVDINGTVNVVLAEDDATGTATIVIDGVEYSGAIKAGQGSIVLPLLPAGKTKYVVTYSGDDKYNGKTTTVSVNVNKYYPTIKATAHSVKYGEDVLINVTNMPELATGTVSVSVDGANYSAAVENGGAIITVPGLAGGEYALDVFYSGDDMYRAYTTNVTFNVIKLSNTISASARTVHVGDNVTVNVKLISDATGTVSITVNGTEFTGDVADGKATIILSGLPVKQGYALEVVYSGDEKYKESNTTVTFNVNKYNTAMNCPTRTVKVGDNVTVQVKLASDATGTVWTVVNGTNYTADVVDGVASFIIPGLPAGSYELEVQYSGDDKYKARSGVAAFNVNKYNVRMKATARTVKVGNNVNVNVVMSEDATGSVAITVGSSTYSAALTNGTATITIPSLPVGQYTYDVKYSGDDKYKNYTTTVSFNVNQ